MNAQALAATAQAAANATAEQTPSPPKAKPLGERVEVRARSDAASTSITTSLASAFDLLATAPEGVAKLRELILDLAVRGSLVAPNPASEPANALLQRIHEARAKLAKAGLIKRSRIPAAVEEPPFELPHGWKWATLVEVCATLTDGDHLPPPRADSGVPFLVIGDVRTGRIDATAASRFVPRDYFEGLDWSRQPRLGDILYTTVGSYGIPAPLVDDAEFCFQRHIALLRPALPELQAFLALALASPFVFAQATAAANGTAQKTVPLSALRAFQIPLPPLAEQRRIVARVEELMGLCDQLEAHGRLQDEQHARLVATLFDALVASASPAELAANWQRVASHFDLLLDRPEAVDALEQTILQLAVHGLLVPQDPGDEPAKFLCARIRAAKAQTAKRREIKSNKALPPVCADEAPFGTRSGWSWERFGELVSISSGLTLGRKSTPSKPVTLPYLRVANVQRWHLTLAHLKTIIVDEAELPRFLLRNGDLLLTEGGDWDKVGRTCIWRGEVDRCLHQNHIFKARGISAEWSPAWAELFLNSRDARDYFGDASKQTTNLASINSTQLKNCPFPVPPLAEQHRIVARVEALRGLCADLRLRLQQARTTQSNLAVALVAGAATWPGSSSGRT